MAFLDWHEEFAGEGCGLVEAEVGFGVGRILIGIILGPVEEPVDHAQVVVETRIGEEPNL
mgnify:CR=1 FL=1